MNLISDKNILITGGMGFIGSNLARRLLDLNNQVTVVDSLIPEYGGNLRNLSDVKEKSPLISLIFVINIPSEKLLRDRTIYSTSRVKPAT